MHFWIGLEMAVTALFCQTAFSNPVALKRPNALAARTAVPMARADAFSNSGTDFETWGKRMVDEGEMWYPEKRSIEVPKFKGKKETVVVRHVDGTRSLERRTGQLKLNNILCGTYGGNEDLYSEGQNKFCRFEREAITASAKLIEYAIQQGLCNGESCDFYVELGATVATVMAQIANDQNCDRLFEQVREVCRGSGGVAQIFVEAPRSDFSEFCGPPICNGSGVATNVGHLSAQFFERDPGWQCPAPSSELICKKELF